MVNILSLVSPDSKENVFFLMMVSFLWVWWYRCCGWLFLYDIKRSLVFVWIISSFLYSFQVFIMGLINAVWFINIWDRSISWFLFGVNDTTLIWWLLFMVYGHIASFMWLLVFGLVCFRCWLAMATGISMDQIAQNGVHRHLGLSMPLARP